jgi:hypothetical protein
VYNIDAMSRDELLQFVKSGGMIHIDPAEEWPDGGAAEIAPAENIKRVEVEGVEVPVHMDRLQTWRAAKLVAAMQDPRMSDGERLPYLIEFFEYVLGDALADAVEAMGGDDAAQVADVLEFARAALEAAGEKKY